MTTIPPSPAAMGRNNEGYDPLHPPRVVQITDSSRGGWITKRPADTNSRLILNFNPSLCCSAGDGLEEQDLVVVPPILAARGVTQYEWRDCVRRLKTEVQPQHHSTCCCITLGLTVVCLPLVCYVENRYQKAAAKWLEDLNKQVLVPKGMYAKLQTNEFQINNGESNYYEEISWLAVALTEEEAERLRSEPVFWTPACCEPATVPHPCQGCFCCCCSSRIV